MEVDEEVEEAEEVPARVEAWASLVRSSGGWWSLGFAGIPEGDGDGSAKSGDREM